MKLWRRKRDFRFSVFQAWALVHINFARFEDLNVWHVVGKNGKPECKNPAKRQFKWWGHQPDPQMADKFCGKCLQKIYFIHRRKAALSRDEDSIHCQGRDDDSAIQSSL